eukprot:245943_1
MASYFRANGFTAWKCDTCGLVNSEQQLICQACFDMRPTPIEMFKSDKLETLVSGFYRQIDDKNPLEAGIVRKTISNIHGECDFCRKPLSLSDIDLSPFDCDHTFHQTCLLEYGDSKTLVAMFKKFNTGGRGCPVKSCHKAFNKVFADIRGKTLRLEKDGSATTICFYDDGKTAAEHVQHHAIGDDHTYVVNKQWSESNNLKYLEYEYYFGNYFPFSSYYKIKFDHDNGN